MTADQMKKALTRKRKKADISVEGAVSTGSTLLNLACSDHPEIGFLKGGYYYLVGDSASGKTWLSLSCFAESQRNPGFKDYRLVFDDVEGGAMMDLEHYFGKAVADCVEAPSYTKDKKPIFSDTVQKFYFHITKLLAEDVPFIYVLDSQDALNSDYSADKFFAAMEAAEKGEKTAGSYGDGKAKYHSEHLRTVLSGLRRTGSILIIIGQTRDNLGMGFEQKTRSGGRALRFYANLEIWTVLAQKIKKTVRGKERTIGVNTKAEVRKNRITGKVGKDREVTIPIFYGHGIDDVGSCVDYLISEKHWENAVDEKTGKKKKTVFEVEDFLFKGTREKIIAHVEEEGLEDELRQIVAKVWNEIEEECKPKRKRRYE